MFGLSVQAKVVTSNHLALYGQAKYSDNFKAFDFVNSHAPKGGRVVMPSYGTFDSFNPFIFKGIPSAESVALTLDTLGVVPNDDYSTVYPLIAQKFELPDDNSFVGFIL